MEKNTQLKIAKQLNNSVVSVLGQENLKGFERAYMIANATAELKQLLTPEYMKPIMQLQGNVLGFKTDKDNNGGYSEAIVKNCLIEAVLMGLQPYGNQFNIIAGNTYPTKQGLGYLLSNYKGLSYEIVPSLPRVNKENTSAAIVMNVFWSINNSTKRERQIEIPIKVNKFMGTDAIIGKATRKARAWLYSTITGSEISDGDIQDLDSQTIDVEVVNEEDKRISSFIQKAETIEELQEIKNSLDEEQLKLFSDEITEAENQIVFNQETKA
ncbi:hypothetical protein [Tenacibaculum caenipelagi]|nr:hypothetical protein [Tenacibaculum caenipelagi]